MNFFKNKKKSYQWQGRSVTVLASTHTGPYGLKNLGPVYMEVGDLR